jgi:hypothetical protein
MSACLSLPAAANSDLAWSSNRREQAESLASMINSPWAHGPGHHSPSGIGLMAILYLAEPMSQWTQRCRARVRSRAGSLTGSRPTPIPDSPIPRHWQLTATSSRWRSCPAASRPSVTIIFTGHHQRSFESFVTKTGSVQIRDLI